MSELIEWFAERYPDDVTATPIGGFVAVDRALEFVGAAQRNGVAIVSVEAYLVGSDLVGYPVRGRKRDLLNLDQMDCETLVGSTARAVRRLLEGVWSEAPTVDMTPCLHDDVDLRSMICFALDQ